MGSTAAVFIPGPAVEEPMTTVQQWDPDEYPPMGTPADICDQINSWITAAGLGTPWRDDTSRVILPNGVAAVSFHIHHEAVRSIWISRPTGELLELFCRNGHQLGWRVFDVDSETEYLLSDFS